MEVGLGHAPTLANLAAKTLQLVQFAGAGVKTLNVQRDAAAVYSEDEPKPFIGKRRSAAADAATVTGISAADAEFGAAVKALPAVQLRVQVRIQVRVQLNCENRRQCWKQRQRFL
ncbi:hypothetical protein RQN30_11840 [Arcanobacterium hippocoleae]